MRTAGFSGLRSVLALAGMLLAAVPSSAADIASGSHSIVLVTASGEKLEIGAVTFTPDGDGAKFDVTLASPDFQEHFLSMRPFQCLTGEKEAWCHLAYPYDMKKRISAGDLVDLEYALLFLFKPPQGYGIDAWNGLYFKLQPGENGGFTGAVHEVNLNPLAVPPEDRSQRVIAHSDLSAVSPETHRFARVEIIPVGKRGS
jgi:hypothetical protein